LRREAWLATHIAEAGVVLGAPLRGGGVLLGGARGKLAWQQVVAANVWRCPRNRRERLEAWGDCLPTASSLPNITPARVFFRKLARRFWYSVASRVRTSST
jgi:hypothetical protein